MPLEHINVTRERVNTAAGGEKFTATPEELRIIQDKMKDPVFAELMHEYMQSLEDPETRREEEAYLEQAEREAREGGDFSFEFVFPRAAFVVELLQPSHTTASAAELKKLGLVATPPLRGGAAGNTNNKSSSNGGAALRSFLNVCASEKVKTFTERTTGDAGGSNWEVPVSVSQRRVEAYQPVALSPSTTIPAEYAPPPPPPPPSSSSSSSSSPAGPAVTACVVHDVVYHPATLALAERSTRFMCFLIEIAVEHVNAGYHESNGFAFRRLPSSIVSIGTPQNQTLRSSAAASSPFDADPRAPVLTRPTMHLPTTVTDAPTNAVATKAPAKEKSATAPAAAPAAAAAAASLLPPYTIAHRGSIDLAEAWRSPVLERRVGVPEELVVKMSFDGVRRAAMLDVSITADGLAVRIDRTADQTRYDGLIVLPFTVEEVPRRAQFDCARGLLTLTLKVVPPPLPAGATTAAELRRTLPGAVCGDAPMDAPMDAPVDVPVDAPVNAPVHAPVDAPSPPTSSSSPPTCVPAAETGALSSGAAAPPTAGPEVAHIGDQDRVTAMLAQVRAAREAREAAAVAMSAAEGTHRSSSGASTDTAEAAAATSTAAESIPYLRKTGGRVAASSRGAEKSGGDVVDHDDDDDDDGGMAALRARQQAWAAMVEVEMTAAKAREEAEATRAAQEAEAQTVKARRRAAAEKEVERLAHVAKLKRDALPLTNKFIFSID